ncbi:MAG: hypothetical protein ABW169_05225 [Sphingobium sp.]
MSRKPKSKLPAGWEVYSSANRKPTKARGIAKWKYAVWALVLAALASLAFFPSIITERF